MAYAIPEAPRDASKAGRYRLASKTGVSLKSGLSTIDTMPTMSTLDTLPPGDLTGAAPSMEFDDLVEDSDIDGDDADSDVEGSPIGAPESVVTFPLRPWMSRSHAFESSAEPLASSSSCTIPEPPREGPKESRCRPVNKARYLSNPGLPEPPREAPKPGRCRPVNKARYLSDPGLSTNDALPTISTLDTLPPKLDHSDNAASEGDDLIRRCRRSRRCRFDDAVDLVKYLDSDGDDADSDIERSSVRAPSCVFTFPRHPSMKRSHAFESRRFPEFTPDADERINHDALLPSDRRLLRNLRLPTDSNPRQTIVRDPLDFDEFEEFRPTESSTVDFLDELNADISTD